MVLHRCRRPAIRHGNPRQGTCLPSKQEPVHAPKLRSPIWPPGAIRCWMPGCRLMPCSDCRVQREPSLPSPRYRGVSDHEGSPHEGAQNAMYRRTMKNAEMVACACVPVYLRPRAYLDEIYTGMHSCLCACMGAFVLFVVIYLQIKCQNIFAYIRYAQCTGRTARAGV